MANRKESRPMVNWVYDLWLWVFSILVDLFFREVHPRGSWKIPRRGPIIFVAAPHANQFVDPLILMRVIKTEAQRRISWLIAEKSMKRRFIGAAAGMLGPVSVGRALDSTKPGSGKIYLPDPEGDPLLIRGNGTKLEKEAEVGGLLVLPTVNGLAANSEIAEIHGPEEIRLKKDFKGDVAIGQLTGRYIPDGSRDKDFRNGGALEGKEEFQAGVAIMALGSLAANPESNVKIIPCGMNYFHAHKFRSRAVVEFGTPIEVPKELVDLYKNGERREATKQLLETVHQALVAVTVSSPDYDTLMLIQAARRLYNPTGKKLPLPMIVELNRRLVKGYSHYKDDPRIVNLQKSVNDYNKQLWLLGVRDHQVEYAKFSIPKVIFTLFYRLGKLSILAIATLPGLVLFAPVFIATKIISIRKSKEALAASTVKLEGRDVVATWKLLVAMGFAPLLYIFYTVLLTWWTYRNRVQGYMPPWVPLWLVVTFGFVFFPAITFAALRFGESGMDILKSLRPLVLSLNPTSANTLSKLREKRKELSAEVTEVINTLGPEMFPDFDSARIIADPFRNGMIEGAEPRTPRTPRTPSRKFTDPPTDVPSSGHLPRNESFNNLSNIGLFASRPQTPRSHSRSRSGSQGAGGFGGMKGFSMLSSKESLDQVSQKIRGAMRERGRRRRSGQESGSGGFGMMTPDGEGSGSMTPGSEAEGRKDI
ncbi:MAG: hypothetical protein Q9207_006379 [Kuettlingeria erythrocarpa]